jgi:hypothetical protein
VSGVIAALVACHVFEDEQSAAQDERSPRTSAALSIPPPHPLQILLPPCLQCLLLAAHADSGSLLLGCLAFLANAHSRSSQAAREGTTLPSALPRTPHFHHHHTHTTFLHYCDHTAYVQSSGLYLLFPPSHCIFGTCRYCRSGGAAWPHLLLFMERSPYQTRDYSVLAICFEARTSLLNVFEADFQQRRCARTTCVY